MRSVPNPHTGEAWDPNDPHGLLTDELVAALTPFSDEQMRLEMERRKREHDKAYWAKRAWLGP